MKPCRFAISTLCLCACAVPEVHAIEARAIGVYLEFEAAPSRSAFENMKTEVASILRPAGLRLEWRDISDRDKHESFPALLVIRLTGTCDSPSNFSGAYSPEAQAAALASTAVVDGHVLPFSEIECDKIRSFIAPLTRGLVDRDAVLGKAIGRVMAHEMYHMLLEETKHAESGVGRARHRRDELVRPQFRFADSETARLRSYADRIFQTVVR